MVEQQRTEENEQCSKAQRRLQYDNYRQGLSNTLIGDGPWHTKAEPTAGARDHYTETKTTRTPASNLPGRHTTVIRGSRFPRRRLKT